MSKRTRDYSISKIVKRDYVLFALKKGDWEVWTFYKGREKHLLSYSYIRSLATLAKETPAYEVPSLPEPPNPWDEGFFY